MIFRTEFVLALFRKNIVFIFMVVFYSTVYGQGTGSRDSISKADIVITPRFNSAGHFPYTGALLNKNINFDLNVFFEYKSYGFFLFKSFDLEDKHSYVNYFQPGIFKTFQSTPSLKWRLFFGYVFSQTSGFRDSDSDYYTAAVVYWTITDNLKVENTALFFDLTISSKLANRLLLSWTINKFTFDMYVWHRIVWEGNVHATSASIAVNLPSIRLSESLSIRNTFSYQGYVDGTKPDFARTDGFMYSIAFPIVGK